MKLTGLGYLPNTTLQDTAPETGHPDKMPDDVVISIWLSKPKPGSPPVPGYSKGVAEKHDCSPSTICGIWRRARRSDVVEAYERGQL